MTNLISSELVFDITPDEESWTVVGPTPDSPPLVVPSPFKDKELLSQVGDLRRFSSVKLSSEQVQELGLYEDVARELSERITPLLLTPTACRALRRRINQVRLGRVRLTIRVADHGPLGDEVLALPWEVLAPDGRSFPVRESTLEIVRESVSPGAPGLPTPLAPLAVAVAVAAPEDQASLSFEKEEVRLQAALARLGHAVSFSDLGTLDDLVAVVAAQRANALLFSGHGLPGRLLFENRFGFADPVAVEEVVRRLRTQLLDPERAGAFPGVFFLSCCDGATSKHGPSTAASLHRAGFSQVIGFFGGARDSATSRAEQTFFQALAEGRFALQAAHQARASLVNVFEQDEERLVFPLAWTQLAIYHRGEDRPVALAARPPGRSLSPRFRRAVREDRGVPLLVQGFVGRRALQHEILRRVDGGERLLVLHGLAGSGKTALAAHLMTRRLALASEASTLLLEVPDDQEADEAIASLCLQSESHGRRHALSDWEGLLLRHRTAPRVAAEAFSRILRALHERLPDLAVFVDGVDRLQAGPESGSPVGAWLPGAEPWWKEMVEISESGVLILLSTRWPHPDMPPRSHVALPPLSGSDAFRMMSFFGELARLAPAERRELVEWSEGHADTIAVLDDEIGKQLGRRGLGYDPEDPWRELVEPALPEAAERVRRRAQVPELWASLSPGAREHGRKLAEREEAMSLATVDGLGDFRDELIRSGLLQRHLDEVGGLGTARRIERWRLTLHLRGILGELGRKGAAQDGGP